MKAPRRKGAAADLSEDELRVVKRAKAAGLSFPGPSASDRKVVMAIVKQLARLPDEQLERSLRQVATTRSWQRWLIAASPSRSDARKKPQAAPRPPKAQSPKKGGTQGPFCHAHNMVRDRCPLCAGTWKVVYMSGGGTRYHRVPDCSALVRGQEMVDDRGGTREKVVSVVRNSSRLMGRNPCATCIPAVFRQVQQTPSCAETRRRVAKAPVRVPAAHVHRWGAWRSEGDGTVQRSCYECPATELRIGSSTPPAVRPPRSVAPPPAPPPSGRPRSQPRVFRTTGFVEAARQLADCAVERPPGVPKKNWTAVGTMSVGCTECGSALGVLEHPGTHALVLVCRACRRAWPSSDYDDRTRQWVEDFVGRPKTTPKAAKRSIPLRTTSVEVTEAEPDDDRRSFGPGRIPTGDGPRSHPRKGWTSRW